MVYGLPLNFLIRYSIEVYGDNAVTRLFQFAAMFFHWSCDHSLMSFVQIIRCQ